MVVVVPVGAAMVNALRERSTAAKNLAQGDMALMKFVKDVMVVVGEIKYYRLEERKRSLSISLANKILQSRFRELIIYSKILDFCACVEWEMEKLRERNSVKEDVGKYLYENAPRYTF